MGYLDGLTDEDDDRPYDSISSRGPTQPIMDRPQTAAPMAAPNPAIAAAISGRNSTPVPQDPLMAQFEANQSRLDDYRNQKQQGDFASNLGLALSGFAQGSNAPVQNKQLFENMQQQSSEALKGKEQDLTNRNKVMEAIEARKAKAGETALTREARAHESEENRKMRQAMMGQSQEFKKGTQDAMVNRTMGQVVTRINNDPIIKPSELNLASLHKSKGILDNESVPLTSQSLSDAEQDIASALSLRGMGATEGKIKRTEIETIGRRLAEFKQSHGGGIQDLRKEAPELVGQIKKLNNALIEDYKTTLNDRYERVYGDYEAAFGDDKRFQDRIAKMKEHGMKGLGPSEGSAPAAPQGKAGKLVKVRGKMYRVGSDGDTLEEVM